MTLCSLGLLNHRVLLVAITPFVLQARTAQPHAAQTENVTSKIHSTSATSVSVYSSNYGQSLPPTCLGPSRFEQHGHCHEVLVADLYDTVLVAVTSAEGVRQPPQHHTCLNEVVKLKAPPTGSVKKGDNQLR